MCDISPKLVRETRVWKTIREEDQESSCKHLVAECSGNPTEQTFLALHLSQLQAEFQPKLSHFYIFSADIQARNNSTEVNGFLFSFPLCSSNCQQAVSCLFCHGGGREAVHVAGPQDHQDDCF